MKQHFRNDVSSTAGSSTTPTIFKHKLPLHFKLFIYILSDVEYAHPEIKREGQKESQKEYQPLLVYSLDLSDSSAFEKVWNNS